MIKIDLERMVKGLEEKVGKRVTLSEIAEKSGVHRSILSRLINRPQENTSTEHIDKLAQFFFFAYKEAAPTEFPASDDVHLMQLILGRLIQVFPEQGPYWALLNKLRENGSVEDIPVYRLWEFYKASIPSLPMSEPAAKRNKALAEKLQGSKKTARTKAGKKK